jgi:Asp-tRNA(Asn)/Glu-tRNA(Gln) amidotransferase B subunit
MEIIDTLAYAKRLIQSGVPESQAEIQAETLSNALSEVLSNNVATKLDIKELETKMIKWFAGVVIAQTITIVGIVIALLKLLH